MWFNVYGQSFYSRQKIIIRHETYSNTQYHIKETYKLKEYFDNLLGYDLYKLFPEIKDNL